MQKAEHNLLAAAKLGAKSFKVHMLLGTLYFMKQDYGRAETHIKEWVRLNPTDPNGYRFLVRTLMQIREMKEAKHFAERWVEIAQQDAEAHYKFGVVLGNLNEYEKATRCFEKAIEIDPNQPQYHHMLGLGLISSADRLDSESDNAIELNERALGVLEQGIIAAEKSDAQDKKGSIKELQVLVLNKLAYGYAQRAENISIAKRYIEKALSTRPDSPYLLDTKAWVLIREQEASQLSGNSENAYSEIEHLLQKALAGISEEEREVHAEVLFHLGYLEQLRGHLLNAENYFIKSLELKPDFKLPKQELENLKDQ